MELVRLLARHRLRQARVHLLLARHRRLRQALVHLTVLRHLLLARHRRHLQALARLIALHLAPALARHRLQIMIALCARQMMLKLVIVQTVGEFA